jgi:hypothetical protein
MVIHHSPTKELSQKKTVEAMEETSQKPLATIKLTIFSVAAILAAVVRE